MDVLKRLQWAIEGPSKGILRLQDRAVLIYVAFRDGGEGCSSAIESIALELGSSESSIRRILSRLVKFGLISATIRPGNTTSYFICANGVSTGQGFQSDRGVIDRGVIDTQTGNEQGIEEEDTSKKRRMGARRREPRRAVPQAEEWISWWNREAPGRFSRVTVFPRREAKRLEERLFECGYSPERFRSEAPAFLESSYPGAEKWLNLPWLARPKSDLTRLLNGNYAQAFGQNGKQAPSKGMDPYELMEHQRQIDIAADRALKAAGMKGIL